MKRKYSNRQLPDSALRYVLESLIPYTEANIKLAFKPGLFFDDLERIDRAKHYKRETLKKAYYRAVKEDLIGFESTHPKLTEKGLKRLKPYKPRKLKGSKLMIIFDIPETRRAKRDYLRLLLVELRFRQVQKSVWVSSYDSREYLKAEIEEYKLNNHVEIYEAKKLRV